MNKIKNFSIIVCTLLLSLTVIAQNTLNTKDQTQAADFVPGQVLIKLKESAKARKTSLSSQIKATTLKNYTNLGVELWEMQQADNKQATLQLVEQLNNNPDVEYAEPNYLWYAEEGIEPNDPYFPQLWGLNNTGQDSGTADADIDAPEAYCIPLELSDVVVGVIDSGVDYTHEDLAENIWQNLGEDADGDGQVLIKSGNTWIFDPGDENGIDDDSNGYIDDFVGWDFIFNDNKPMDGLSGHGTHVAGTIAAVRDNNIGIAGVAPNAKIAALKFLNDNLRASGPTSAAIEAINYAVAMNIPITNNSWGSTFYNNTLYQTIKNAATNNHLFIAAADNKNRDNDQSPSFPASYDLTNIVSVAATDRDDNRSSFSNYGATTCDIGAPGTDIFSTKPGGYYIHKNGTSMAAPHVTGAAAYMLGAYPNTPYTTIKQSLLNPADPIPALNGKCVSNGRLNLYNALQEMGAPENPCDNEPAPTCNRNTDSLALVALYNSTDGPNWTNTWDFNQPIDNWFGVVLNEDGCVKCLSMNSDKTNLCSNNWSNTGNNLDGIIPDEIGNFSELEVLDLSFNDRLKGNIPNSIGNLTNLERLWLHNCFLTNNIPTEIGNLIKLKSLTINNNNLNGSIPNEIENLIHLSDIRLQFNGLTGNIPSGIGNLTNLATLTLYNNNLSGSIPIEIGQLYKLRDLFLSENVLTGTIPDEICELTNLAFFSVFDNRIEGEIPTCVNNLLFLKYFSVGKNLLEGEIPEEFFQLDSLTTLFVNDNDLTGCYSEGLNKLCTQVTNIWSPGNAGISDGNNFDFTWEDFCNTGAGSCGPFISQVWPGDADNNGTVEFRDMLFWGAANGNTDTSRPNATTNWVGQSCPDWPVEVNGTNGKHQDANGDGVVNNTDRNVITQNMGQTHNFTEYGEATSSLQFTLNPDLSVQDGSNFAFDFIVDDAGNTVTAHGINASIFFAGLGVANAAVDVSGSSLNPQEVLQEFDAESNTLHFVLTKTNGINSTLNDAVARIVVEVLEVDNGESSALYVIGGHVIQADGTLESVAGTTVNSSFFEPGINSSLIDLTSSTSHANCEVGGKAKVYASGGTGNYTYQWSTGESTQQIVDLSPGIYTVSVYDNNGEVNNIEIEVQGNFIPIYDDNGEIIPCNFSTCPTAIDFEDYVPAGTHKAERAIHTNADIGKQSNVELKAGNVIRLTSGFSTGNNNFSADIEYCE